MKNQSSLSGVFALAAVITLACGLEAQAPPASADSPPVVESYYKMAPGKADEWLELYRTQHLPVLKQRQREGRILQIVIYRPRPDTLPRARRRGTVRPLNPVHTALRPEESR